MKAIARLCGLIGLLPSALTIRDDLKDKSLEIKDSHASAFVELKDAAKGVSSKSAGESTSQTVRTGKGRHHHHGLSEGHHHHRHKKHHHARRHHDDTDDESTEDERERDTVSSAKMKMTCKKRKCHTAPAGKNQNQKKRMLMRMTRNGRMVRNVRIHLEGIEPDIATLRSREIREQHLNL